MRITLTTHLKRFDELNLGDLFMVGDPTSIHGQVFMKIGKANDKPNDTGYNTVVMSEGTLHHIKDNTRVTPVWAKLEVSLIDPE